MRRIVAALLFALPLAASSASLAGPTREVSVSTPRVRLADVVQGAPPELADTDLGPAPAPGGSRVVTREEITKAIAERKPSKPLRISEAVRVVRKMIKMPSAEIERTTRDALSSIGMPRGATLSAVRPPRFFDVPAGYDAVLAELPKPPRRTGPFATQAMITFARGDEVLARFAVPVELTLSQAATIPDCPKGSIVTLVVRRGLVEIAAPALAASPADVGDLLQVTVRSSNRVVRARLIEKDRAEAIED